MKVLGEFTHALVDELGKKEAALFKVELWSDNPESAIAYSQNRELLYLLFLGGGLHGFNGISGLEFLDLAKAISQKLESFVVPDQSLAGYVLWGGKTKGPIYAYKFKVLGKLALPPARQG